MLTDTYHRLVDCGLWKKSFKILSRLWRKHNKTSRPVANSLRRYEPHQRLRRPHLSKPSPISRNSSELLPETSLLIPIDGHGLTTLPAHHEAKVGLTRRFYRSRGPSVPTLLVFHCQVGDHNEHRHQVVQGRPDSRMVSVCLSGEDSPASLLPDPVLSPLPTQDSSRAMRALWSRQI